MPAVISIPYGSIKRIIQRNVCHAVHVISIPYGSIKRDEERIVELHGHRFQFLMVRLKDIRKCRSTSAILISIPYGSIKRTRLPQSRQKLTAISIPYGSIKSFLLLSSRSGFSISIPYGSIKSNALKPSRTAVMNFNSLWFD